MIKLLDDLLIAATCNPNVPGAIVAGLRQALDEARGTASTFAFTGILPTLSREQAKEMVKAAGGKVNESVSVLTDYVVAGKEPGARLEKAVELGIPVIDETSLLRMIGRPKEARDLTGNPADTPGAKVDLSRLGTRENAASRALSQALGVPHPATVRVSYMGSADLPPPFDSMEEAQRAAGIVPSNGASYSVCVRDGESGKVGDVMFIGNVTDSVYPSHADWIPCDSAGWVAHGTAIPPGVTPYIRTVFDFSRNAWRPLKKSEAFGNPSGTPGAKVNLSRLDSPAQEIPTHRTCLHAHDGYVVGEVLPEGQFDRPEHWAPCEKDGWVSSPLAVALDVECEARIVGSTPQWRPVREPKYVFSTGHADAIPKPSALDEMAEQVRRWAVPTRETGDPLEAMFKPANPKDAAATGRVPLGLLSPIAKAHWALAQHCGRAKYGAWNWREAGARASIYLDAIGRHADGYLSGETHDPADGTHHLGNIMACCAILLEAEAAGKLVDDRPPTLDMRAAYADVERRQAELTAKYADRNPKHWTR